MKTVPNDSLISYISFCIRLWVAAPRRISEKIEQLQGSWLSSGPEKSVAVIGSTCIFEFADMTKPSQVTFHSQNDSGKDSLMISRWTLKEITDSQAKWVLNQSEIIWTRRAELEPPCKKLYFKMVWGDPDQAEFADSKIIAADDRVFAVHRAVLAAASPVFRKAFSAPMREAREATININDVPAEAVESLLRFIYNGELDVDRAATVLPLADRYEITELVEVCISQMVRSVNA
eukprot:CAMPEP_0169286582 /NCGR_PEP_ID=MMETSP1016-20121227/59378_1 /TAXON_ID=342587 /ORGANISM="Karlodinium micrum, Strain CCMP2283" /LENGTH=232 /DNA_ID=CAMNT_0009376305 /DNA_START=722 /DNA_END=1418 /DNA_ORIENTATION=+